LESGKGREKKGTNKKKKKRDKIQDDPALILMPIRIAVSRSIGREIKNRTWCQGVISKPTSYRLPSDQVSRRHYQACP
jgi:hypothetical protein